MAEIKAYKGTHTGKQIDDLLDKIPELAAKVDVVQGGDKSEVFNLEQPKKVHTIIHALNKDPPATIVEWYSKNEVIADVRYISKSQIELTFNESTSCIVYLN